MRRRPSTDEDLHPDRGQSRDSLRDQSTSTPRSRRSSPGKKEVALYYTLTSHSPIRSTLPEMNMRELSAGHGKMRRISWTVNSPTAIWNVSSLGSLPRRRGLSRANMQGCRAPCPRLGPSTAHPAHHLRLRQVDFAHRRDGKTMTHEGIIAGDMHAVYGCHQVYVATWWLAAWVREDFRRWRSCASELPTLPNDHTTIHERRS